ncbi:MAG: 30S ribosomal protein S8 [Patescibacteria group bacterium]
MITDPISDMLTRIRNAVAVKKSEVLVPYSKIKFSIAKILEKENYIASVEVLENGKFKNINLKLRYENGEKPIKSLKRISKPGNRVYAKSAELPRPLSDIGVAIISTPNGLMTNKEARTRKLGGEVLCEIY